MSSRCNCIVLLVFLCFVFVYYSLGRQISWPLAQKLKGKKNAEENSDSGTIGEEIRCMITKGSSESLAAMLFLSALLTRMHFVHKPRKKERNEKCYIKVF